MKRTIIRVLTIAGCSTAVALYFSSKQKDSEEKPEPTPEKQAQVEPILVKPNVEYIYDVVYVEVEKTKEIYVDRPIFVKPKKNWDQEMLNGVKFFEGFRSNAYYCCAGVKTIGYGCTDKNIVALGAITEHKAADLLYNHLVDVREKVKAEVKVPITDAQLCALTSFTFNVGMSNLRQLINGPGRLNDGNYESVVKIMPKYRIAAGKIREGLVKRRAWELSLWQGNPQY